MTSLNFDINIKEKKTREMNRERMWTGMKNKEKLHKKGSFHQCKRIKRPMIKKFARTIVNCYK